MKLILIRHAKSSWDHPTCDDHARPLNARGRRAAPLVAAWLAAHGHCPTRVLVSDAARTRETLALMQPALGTPDIVIRPALYHAGPETLRAEIARHADTDTLAVIGHNPGLGELAHSLATSDHPRFADFPTCATAVFDTDPTLTGAQLIAFLTPHDL